MAKNKGNGLLASYLIGFVISVVLTIISFNLVMHHHFSSIDLYTSIALLAVLLLFVQSIFFLRLNAKASYDKWNLVVFFFTIFIICLVVSGSLWIMYNLNYNMVSH
ncbi:MAG: cytochrome o ubiquinol oxidase subunit IV [Gammaproteobacteria bacterium]|jgi:cytochrome o ubiquinol oxidase operon protein cyoD|nr:cytochrome o ubiquinol oxidase subunit IV [Gammaproteobacteria bacterium]